ncbi:hypothetical protein [Nonomuraea sp. JJY05]|uniref:hypothetical protein n=1 Tax=Nonomuraea sp. JJY05 TaxID=3350255 RepID=UPI00373EFBDF
MPHRSAPWSCTRQPGGHAVLPVLEAACARLHLVARGLDPAGAVQVEEGRVEPVERGTPHVEQARAARVALSTSAISSGAQFSRRAAEVWTAASRSAAFSAASYPPDPLPAAGGAITPVATPTP